MAEINDDPSPTIYPPGWMALGCILIEGLNTCMPVAVIVSGGWEYFGIPFILLGAFFVMSSGYLFDASGTETTPFASMDKLVVTGMYCYSRNPIYLGKSLVLLGIAVIHGSVTPFLVAPLFMIIMHYRYVIPEEIALERIFGDEYEAYIAGTRRWI